MPEMSSNSSQSFCMGCGLCIKDQYIYRVQPDIQFHESCLKCSECHLRLEENSTCFIRNNKAYCKADYARLFTAKCNKCAITLKRNDLVMKSKSKVYHLECFSCVVCSRKLMPGEEYYQAKDGLLYCKDDSISVLSTSSSSGIGAVSIYNQSISSSNYLSSTMSVTPESSLTSSSSSSSSSSSCSFSPSTGSSSSSIVDSPSNYSSSCSQLALFHHNLQIQQQHIQLQHHQQQHSHQQQQLHHKLRSSEKFTENDSYQDKEDENSLTDEESSHHHLNPSHHDDDLIDNEDDDQDVSLSDNDDEESISFSSGHEIKQTNSNSSKHNQKSASKSSNNSKQSKKQLKHTNFTSTSSPNNSANNYLQNCFSSGSSSGKPARIRTVLNEKQLHTLRACYGANPRPDALMKEQLVEMTGLNPRVIRVWFQNKRCKDKKKNMIIRPSDMNSTGLHPYHPHHAQQQQQHHVHHHHNVSNSQSLQLPTHPMFDSCF